jgi:hypothetical protein
MLQKQLHHGGIGGWQHQGCHLPFGRRHHGIDVGVFPHYLSRGAGPDSRRRPGPPGDADPSKAARIFGHLQDRRLDLGGTRGNCRLDLLSEVFLNVACSAGSALGWTGRGTNLRQPCRSSSRRMVLVFHLSPHLCLKRLFDLGRRADSSGLRLGEKGRQELLLLLERQVTLGAVPLCQGSPPLPRPAGCRPR